MFRNMKIKKSLLVGFGIIIAACLVIISASTAILLNTRKQYEVLLNEDAEANQDILNCRVSALIPGRNIRDALLIPDSEANQALLVEAQEYLVKLEQGLVTLEGHYPYQLDKEPLYAYQKAVRNWASNAPKLIDLYEKYRDTGNAQYLKDAEDFIYQVDTPLQTEMGNKAVALDTYLVQGMTEERERIENLVVGAIIAIVLGSVATLALIVLFAKALISSITIPTEQVHRALTGFSQGNLDIPVEFEGKNELGEMCQALRDSQEILGAVIGDTGYLLREMANGNFDIKTKEEEKYVGALSGLLQSLRLINRQLSEAIEQVVQSADQVAAGADQVAAGSQALAQGATEQASSVEELSMTISDMSNESAGIALAAQEANSGVETVSEKIRVADGCVEVLNHAMNDIKVSSNEIANIIAVIENIAFQTNILALNAAVEAARAGSAGKGFAVVADEVRNLANKSDEAAKSTRNLINSSIESVEEGANAVAQVTEVFQALNGLSQSIVEQVEKVAAAVGNQSESLAQIKEGTEQISSVVQTNSATSEQSAASSEELSSQAAIIKSLLSRFKTARIGR